MEENREQFESSPDLETIAAKTDERMSAEAVWEVSLGAENYCDHFILSSAYP